MSGRGETREPKSREIAKILTKKNLYTVYTRFCFVHIIISSVMCTVCTEYTMITIA